MASTGAQRWADFQKGIRGTAPVLSKTDNGLWFLLEFHVGSYAVGTRGPLRFSKMFYGGAYVDSPRESDGYVQLVARLRKRVGKEFLYIIPLPEWGYEVSEQKGYFRYHFFDMANVYGPRAIASFKRKVEEAYHDYRLNTDKGRSRQPGRRAFGAFAGSPLRPNQSTLKSVDQGSHTYNVGYNNTPFLYNDFIRSYTSVRTPGFRSKKALQLPVNPHTVNTQWIDEPGCMVRYFKTFDPNGYWGYSWGRILSSTSNYFPPEPQFDTATLNRAISRVVKNAQLDIQANLAQDVSQLGQTVRLIGNTANRISGSVLALRKGNFSGAIQALVDGTAYKRRLRNARYDPTASLARNWLELQYGWKPLLQDVEGSMRSTAQFIAQDRTVQLVRGSSKRRVVTEGPTTGGGGVNGAWTNMIQYQARIGLRFKIDDHLKTYLAQTGFTNPINLGWEILPFSFVVDWFFPLGPYLEQISAWDGLVFVDGYQTQFALQNNSAALFGTTKSAAGSPNEVTYQWGGSARRDWMKLSRTKLTTFPKARFPRLKNPITTTHAANALALLKAVFGRR